VSEAEAGPTVSTAAAAAGPGPAITDLLERADAGGVRAIARLLTVVETGGEPAARLAAALVGRPRAAAVVGLTGAPGAGKSTLTAALVGAYRSRGARVAVVAVDPSSPFTGGALLGDRVRMGEHVLDPGVFIRSMSSRGHLGGLAAAAPAAVDLLAALGFDIVLIETVGVGQSEVDVMHLADTVAVVLAPGMGDAIQAAKAGILEIADVLVVNKADHEGAGATARDLKGMVALGRSGTAVPGEWRPPVLATVAVGGEGIDQLAAALDAHREHLVRTGALRERRARRSRAAVESVVLERVRTLLQSRTGRGRLAAAGDEVADGETDHYTAAEAVLTWLAGTQPPA
jgi:LAO/AO transport system kinase